VTLGILPFHVDALLIGRWPLLLIGTAVLIWFLLPRSTTSPREVAREIVMMVSAFALYFVVRANVDGREFEAFERATDVIQLERALGIFWEIDMQRLVLHNTLLLKASNAVYVWCHFPAIVFTAVWLFFLHREEYKLSRNAFLISGAIGLVIYGMLPVAPPRFMPVWGFVDTVAFRESAQQVSLPPFLLNEYAAMPSLHFGWNLLVGIAIVRNASGPVRALGVIMPALMFLSIVLTGNHYIMDGIAGGLVALMGLWGAYLLRSYLQEAPPGSFRERLRPIAA